MSRLRGQIAELEFKLQAIKRGFRISTPHGDNDPYDFILDSNSKLYRVQVKSSSAYFKGGRKYKFNTSHCSSHRKPYTKDDIDFFALYVVPLNTFHIIPIEETKGQMTFGLYDSEIRFKEAWHLFGKPFEESKDDKRDAARDCSPE